MMYELLDMPTLLAFLDISPKMALLYFKSKQSLLALYIAQHGTLSKINRKYCKPIISELLGGIDIPHKVTYSD
jgi:hypothetical protein